MKDYKAVLFDLDGTLFDSGEGVKKSVEYALNKFGIKVEDRDSLGCFIGPPLTVSFKTFYGFDDEKADRGVAYYREYYADKGIFEGYVYDGIEEFGERVREHAQKDGGARQQNQRQSNGHSTNLKLIAGSADKKCVGQIQNQCSQLADNGRNNKFR